jgi:hypothetical protein
MNAMSTIPKSPRNNTVVSGVVTTLVVGVALVVALVVLLFL